MAKNKINNILDFKDYSVPRPFIDRNTSLGTWVNFGSNNMYPQECLELANASPLQKAILSNKLNYMMGIGLNYDQNIYTPNPFESWDELTKKCMTDFCYLEAFALQIIPNEEGDKYSFYHTPIDSIRLGNYNEENIIEEAYICNNWQSANISTNVSKIKMWGTETPIRGEKYLMYCKPYSTGDLYYSIPSWMSSANWLMADIALSIYYNNYINNNFSANTVIKYPTEPDEDKKALLYEGLIKSFGGSKTGNKLLVLFGENGEMPSIDSLSAVDADLYNQFSEQVLKYIISTNKLTSPVLAGIATGSGFSSKADEMLAAYVLYMNTVVYSARSFVMDKLNNLLNINGYRRCLTIEDFNMKAELEGNTVVNDIKEDEVLNVDTDNNNKDKEIIE